MGVYQRIAALKKIMVKRYDNPTVVIRFDEIIFNKGSKPSFSLTKLTQLPTQLPYSCTLLQVLADPSRKGHSISTNSLIGQVTALYF